MAALTLAVFYNMNSRAANKVPVIALTAIVLLMVALMSILLSLMLEPWVQSLANVSSEMLGWIVVSATIGSAARFLLQTYAQSLTTHSHGVVIMVAEPLWIVLLAFIWYGEKLTINQFVGCVLIFMAMLLSRWNSVVRWAASLRKS
jgi:drug/metabolite transporter (DMT)-like permease